MILSVLARIGETRPSAIAYAFRSGIFRLPNASGQQQPEAPINCSFADVKKSIERLRLASPKLKQAIVDACAHTVLVDNKVSDDEGNLLRAIAITLDCPIPPFLNPSKSQRRTSQAK